MSGYLKATSGAALVTVLLAVAAGGLARAKEAPPERLTIGYEGEGKVDASWQACLASVKEETEGWSKTDIENGARKICAARKRHVEAYAALQSNYRTLMGLLAQDVRLSPAEAAANLKIMMKACIDHKSGITTGGHNIMVDVIENEILLVSDTEPMSKSLIIAIIASLVSTPVNAKPHMQRRTKAQPHSQIACTVLGCSPVPVGCVPRPGRTWSGLPSGFDVIVCPPGARPVR